MRYNGREGGIVLFSYAQLFFSTLKLSACTFGGGYVIVPLMRRRFVDELEWLDEQEMLDLTAIAQTAPGAVAVNASVLVGHRLAGMRGALTAGLATVLPPLVILSVVSVFYAAVRDSAIVSLAMGGMLAGVAAVILDAVITLMRGLGKRKRALPFILLAAAFAMVRFFSVSIVLALFVCAVVGVADTALRLRSGKGGKRK